MDVLHVTDSWRWSLIESTASDGLNTTTKRLLRPIQKHSSSREAYNAVFAWTIRYVALQSVVTRS